MVEVILCSVLLAVATVVLGCVVSFSITLDLVLFPTYLRANTEASTTYPSATIAIVSRPDPRVGWEGWGG